MAVFIADMLITPAQAANQVSTKTLAAGTPYATTMYIIKSGNPGPVVMVVGGVHGNETAGYTAADKIKDTNIKSGTLLVIPRANNRAIERHVRYISGEYDLNRAFPAISSSNGINVLARSIYITVKDYDVDWLIDLHEGYDYSTNRSTDSVGQSLIYYPYSESSIMASKIVKNLNQGIASTYQKFQLLRLPIKGSLARSTGQYLGVRSMIFETCSKPALSLRVDRQLKAVNTLLSNLGMI